MAENMKPKIQMRSLCLKFMLTGDLITSGERCDFALDVIDEKNLYLVELKGCDKAHAFEQLLATMDYMKGKGLERIYFPRIIVSKDAAPNIKSRAEKQMERLVNTHKCEKYVVKTRFYSESI
ncbi:hypothetical protein [Treponema succinifaciens]|uniref:hypothetical protein n=1 Tax=Treponema succinifaciens TaxID=167 RepID=UPI003F7F3CFF